MGVSKLDEQSTRILELLTSTAMERRESEVMASSI